jgi:putative ABC transport system substrate-binding protein
MRSDPRPGRLPRALRVLAVVILVVEASGSNAVVPVVAVIKSGALPPFERATNALTAALRQVAVPPEILTFDLEGDEANGSAVLARVRQARPNLIITVGSLATASTLAEPGSEPVVFSMVLYPEQNGFVGAGRERVTGASLDIPADVQFGYVRRLLPAARRIGVLFHSGVTAGVVEAARGAASRHGLTLVAKSVAERGDAVGALRALMEEVDVVWAVADGDVFTPQATSALILASLRRRVPMIGLSIAHVRAGALAALFSDYDDVGEQTAALALRVLQGEAPRRLPVTTPRRVGLALNLRTAKHLRLTLPPDVEAEAKETVR